MACPRSPGEVNCARCGRGNPEHVRYCLDCGGLLQGERLVVPRATPSSSAGDAAGVAESPSGTHEVAHPVRTSTGRPPAPDLNFASRSGPDEDDGYRAGLASVTFEQRPLQPAVAAPPSGASSPATTAFGTAAHETSRREATEPTTTCPACSTSNPAESSFCSECGATIGARQDRPLAGTIVAVGGARSNAALRAVPSPETQTSRPRSFPPIEPRPLAEPRPDACAALRAAPAAPAAAQPASARQAPIPMESRSPAEPAGTNGQLPSSPPTQRTFGAPTGGVAAVAHARGPELEAPPPGALPSFQTCPRCAGANSAEARFCQLCGVPLTDDARLRPIPTAPESAPSSGLLPIAWLVVIGQDGTPGRRYPLRGSTMDIGRTSGDIVLEKDPYVCPLHARLTYGSRGFAIEDLGSVNGVYVRLGGSPLELRHGDLLLLGQAVLRLEIVEETEGHLGPAVRDSTRVFGTPAVARRARLVLHTVEGCARDIFYLSRPETILGREAGDIVFTDDPFMSRRHAALRRASGTNTYTLRDLGSSNGTFIAIRGKQSLSPGDHVRIGQHLFRLDVQSGGPS